MAEENLIAINCPLCGGPLKLPPNEVRKCRHCGRNVIKRIDTRSESPKSAPPARPLRSVDPVRFRTAGGGFGIGSARGNRQDNLDSWETPTPIRKPGRRTPRQSVGRFPRKPEHDIFHNQKSYQIIIYDLPFKVFEDVRCEIINGILVVESLLDGFDFLQKFSLPEDIIASSLKTGLKNSILNICFEKKQKREEGEQ